MYFKEYDKAISDIEKALELRPDDKDIQELKQECLRKMKEYR